MVTRQVAGMWGIVSFAVMAIVLVGFLVLLGLPTITIWCGTLFAGALLLLQIVSVMRGTARRTQSFSAFENNGLGEPATEEYLPPVRYAMAVSGNESVLAWHAPILRILNGMSGLLKGGTWRFLGKGKTTDAENGLVLTQKRLLFLMVGPDTIRNYCSSPNVTRFLDSLPGDAFAKRHMLWKVGAREVADALSGLVAAHSLEQIMQTNYCFTIPLAEIDCVNCWLKRHTIELKLAQISLQYSLHSPEELSVLAGELRGLGLNVQVGQ